MTLGPARQTLRRMARRNASLAIRDGAAIGAAMAVCIGAYFLLAKFEWSEILWVAGFTPTVSTPVIAAGIGIWAARDTLSRSEASWVGSLAAIVGMSTLMVIYFILAALFYNDGWVEPAIGFGAFSILIPVPVVGALAPALTYR